MQKLSDKKITIIHRSGQNVSEPLAPKKGLTLLSFFTSSRAEPLGKSTTTVLKEPVLKSPHLNIPRANLTAVKNWVALEEKIVHDYKEQKTAQFKSAVSLPQTPAKQSLPGPSNLNNQEKKISSLAAKKGFTLFGFFTSPGAEPLGKSTTTVLNEPVLKSPHLNIPRANLTAVKNWVALEEKIVHDYKAQKTAQFKGAVSLPQTPTKQPLTGPSNLNNQEKKVSTPLAAKKEFTLFGFFSSPKIGSHEKSDADLPKESVLKSPHLNIPRANLTAVKNWVALEEKIVHDYKAQKTAQFKSAVSLPQTPAKQSLPAFETFSTQTAVSSSLSAPKLKVPLRGSEKTFSRPERFLWVLGWLAAGVLALLYVQETFSSHETSQKLSQLQSEKKQLEQSYAVLKNTSEDQSAEMEWLNGQLRDMAMELKMAKAGYESELNLLRGTVQTQDAIVKALKAQGQAFEKVIDQVGMSALSGAAAGLSQEPFSTGGTSVLQGKVTSVNERQGFVVISGGATQGARSGHLITISRSGIGLAAGRIDRVYPTMSVAVLRTAGMLQVIQEGDSVSFS